jgi:hypothetical protein
MLRDEAAVDVVCRGNDVACSSSSSSSSSKRRPRVMTQWCRVAVHRVSRHTRQRAGPQHTREWCPLQHASRVVAERSPQPAFREGLAQRRCHGGNGVDRMRGHVARCVCGGGQTSLHLQSQGCCAVDQQPTPGARSCHNQVQSHRSIIARDDGQNGIAPPFVRGRAVRDGPARAALWRCDIRGRCDACVGTSARWCGAKAAPRWRLWWRRRQQRQRCLPRVWWWQERLCGGGTTDCGRGAATAQAIARRTAAAAERIRASISGSGSGVHRGYRRSCSGGGGGSSVVTVMRRAPPPTAPSFDVVRG